MAQLTNRDRNLDAWLEEQYDALEEGVELVPLSQFTKPYISEKAPTSKESGNSAELEREVGRVFGILGHHIGELNRIKGVKKPASLKYRQLKAAIAKLSIDAEKAGIKFEITSEPVGEDETIIEEPVTESDDSFGTRD